MAGISKWFVVHTYSGYENKVMDSIQKVVENRAMHDLVQEVLVPTETVEETKEDGTVKEVERKTFPGYVFVKVAVEEENGEYVMSDDTWYVIRNTRGVTGFVGPESKPIPLTDAEVKNLNVQHTQTEVDYKVGDYVTISAGPMQGFSGTVESIDVENNVTSVLTTAAFGREMKIEVEVDQVELAV